MGRTVQKNSVDLDLYSNIPEVDQNVVFQCKVLALLKLCTLVTKHNRSKFILTIYSRLKSEILFIVANTYLVFFYNLNDQFRNEISSNCHSTETIPKQQLTRSA